MSAEEDVKIEEATDLEYADPVAARISAMSGFMRALDSIQSEEIRKEGLKLMLKLMDVVPRSIRTLPQAELVSMKGGKSEG